MSRSMGQGYCTRATLLAIGALGLLHVASPVFPQEEGPEITHVMVSLEYSVGGTGEEASYEYGQMVQATVFHPEGSSQLESFVALDPTGRALPEFPELFEITPDLWSFAWAERNLASPPIFGTYTIIATDKQGQSDTFISWPTDHVSDRVPTITYPRDEGYVSSVVPTFRWEAFSDTTTYLLEILGPPENLIWRIELPPEETEVEFNSDGGATVPELTPGETYNLLVFAYEDVCVDTQCYRDTSIRGIHFTVPVYLLLHGYNSGPDAWKKLKDDRFAGDCPELSLVDPAPPAGKSCYRLRFLDRFDADGELWPNGDGSTYTQLGLEVHRALSRFVDPINPGEIVLVGHSRGGLAARAYLQDFGQSRPYPQSLLTIGTPHQGSPFGRIKHWMDDEGYTYRDVGIEQIIQHCFLTPSQLCRRAIAVAGVGQVALRRPVFSPAAGYLASAHHPGGTFDCDGPVAQAICDLNAGIADLTDPVSVFGYIASAGLDLGEIIFRGRRRNFFWFVGGMGPSGTFRTNERVHLPARSGDLGKPKRRHRPLRLPDA